MNKKLIIFIILITVLILLLPLNIEAVSKDDVKNKVAASSKEEVSGSIFIWFLCAMAFLKVSQKIDSFMSSLGINVGHTGGSMLGELMIAARGLSIAKNIGGGGSSSGGGKGSGKDGGGEGFLSGGLVGAVGRKITDSAVKSATGQGGGSIGKAAFESSLAKGGGFANSVIQSIATGSIGKMGSITGTTAETAFNSYMGYTRTAGAPSFSNVEIGGGRMMGTETSAANPGGIEFGMYNADQYMTPDGAYTTETAKDGSKWYKQYATDTVERTPYTAPGGGVAYNETIVQKLPKMPQRKDRV